MTNIAIAMPRIVASGPTKPGIRRRRSSRIVGIVSAGRGRGGETMAMRTATIAVGPALLARAVTIEKRILRTFSRAPLGSWPPAPSLGLARPRARPAAYVRPTAPVQDVVLLA